MTSPARRERTALLDLMAEVGPAAPTLCAGWTTHDLAAHLFVRDRRPQALPGLIIPALHPVTAQLERSARRTPYEELLATLRKGMPPWSPLGLPGGLYEATNLHEFYLYHEDVRRLVTPGPRRDGEDLDGPLWRRLGAMRLMLRVSARGLGITLQTPDGMDCRLRKGPLEVVLRGTVRELVVWLSGRRDAATVEVTGSPEALARLEAVPLGL